MPEVTTVTLVLLFFEELILGMFFSQLQPILLTICGVASLYLRTDTWFSACLRCMLPQMVQTATHEVDLTPVHWDRWRLASWRCDVLLSGVLGLSWRFFTVGNTWGAPQISLAWVLKPAWDLHGHALKQFKFSFSLAKERLVLWWDISKAVKEWRMKSWKMETLFALKMLSHLLLKKFNTAFKLLNIRKFLCLKYFVYKFGATLLSLLPLMQVLQ